jgi:NitT/TauT family transport system substrate-binding protein
MDPFHPAKAQVSGPTLSAQHARNIGRCSCLWIIVLWAVFLAFASGSGSATAQPLQKVRIVVGGTTVLGIVYPWLNLPLALGYWKDEGYEVEVLGLAPTIQPMPLLVAGRADFIQTGSSDIVQANLLGNQPVRVAMQNTSLDWEIGVPTDSNIKTLQDLKGKKIGVLSLAAGGINYLKTYMVQCGMDPEKDISLIAVGFGAPAIHALRSGAVQGLFYWSAGLASFENAGLAMRYISAPDWRTYPDYSLAVMESTLEKDPKMVEAIVRGAAKATLFAMTNPDAVRQIQWKTFPDTKPTGDVDEATLIKWDLNNLDAELKAMKESFQMNGGKYYGNTDPAGFDRLQAFMLATGQISKTVPGTTFLPKIPDFYAQANNFDHAAVIAAAQKWKP